MKAPYMTSNNRFVFILGVILLGCLCSNVNAADVQDGGMLVYGEIGNPISLEPITSNDTISTRLVDMIFNSMVSVNENLKVRPELAKSWETKRDENGQTHYIFYLRDDVFWHDGKKFSAEDVVFTFSAIMDKNSESLKRSKYKGMVQKITAIDDNTVEVVLFKNVISSIANLNFKIIPKHAFENTTITRKLIFAKKPVGTGPYKVVRWLGNQMVMLSANSKYFKGNAHIKQIIMRVLPDRSVMTAELETGGLDMIVKLAEGDIQRFKANREFKVYSYPEMSYVFFAFNLKKPLLKNKNFRKALSLGTDRRGMLRAIYNNRGQIISGPFTTLSWAYNPLVRPLPYSPKDARRILLEEGFQDTDGDGYLENGGKNIVIKLKCYSGYETTVQRCIIFQQNMKKIGIKVDLIFREWSTFIKEVFDDHDFDMTTLSWKLGVDPDIFAIFHSSEIGKGQNNFISYSNRDVDKMLEAGRTTTNFKKRMAVYRKLHRLIADDYPYIFGWTEEVNTPIRATFNGIKQNPMNILNSISDWYQTDTQE